MTQHMIVTRQLERLAPDCWPLNSLSSPGRGMSIATASPTSNRA